MFRMAVRENAGRKPDSFGDFFTDFPFPGLKKGRFHANISLPPALAEKRCPGGMVYNFIQREILVN